MTPKVTISPASAATPACAQSCANFAPSLNTWSAANTATTVFGIARRRPGRRRADGRGAVAPLRLEQDRRLGADLLQLLGDPEAIVEIGDDDRRLENRAVADQR